MLKFTAASQCSKFQYVHGTICTVSTFMYHATFVSLLLTGRELPQVQTALYAFDMLQKLIDIQKVNCNFTEFDKQLFTSIFVADLVEHKLGVDVSKLDTPPPKAVEPAPQPAPLEDNNASHNPVPH